MMVISRAWEWLPRLSPQMWAILLFLSCINTALAFTLWNTSLTRLTAFEANIINNTMLVQIAILSWIFLGDAISWKMAAGGTECWVARCWTNMRSNA
jgi:drug/metabolite transporter (DMT)-like permease